MCIDILVLNQKISLWRPTAAVHNDLKRGKNPISVGKCTEVKLCYHTNRAAVTRLPPKRLKSTFCKKCPNVFGLMAPK